MLSRSLALRAPSTLGNLKASMMYRLKKRDPGEGRYNHAHVAARIWQRQTMSIFLAFSVAGTVVFDQLRDPSSVKMPIQDGRSLVT